MPKNKNQNIFLNITNKIIDLSNNKNKNRSFLFLQDANKENNKSLLNNTIKNTVNNKIDIKNNNLIFLMKFNSILDDLKKNREENDNLIKNRNISKFVDSMDKTSDKEIKTRDMLSLVPYKKYKKDRKDIVYSKSDINNIIKNINSSYNIYNNDISTNIVKSCINKKKNSSIFFDFSDFPNTNNSNTKKSNSDIPFINFMFGPPATMPNSLSSFNINPRDQKSKSTSNIPPLGSFSGAGFPNFINTSDIPGQNYKPPRVKIPEPINIKKTKVVIEREINGLSDILQLIDDYPIKMDVEYNINMQALHDIKLPLLDLNNMIGMEKLKDSVVDQIVFFSQNLHKDNDFMHTVIYGPPGTGKTEIAKIMGNIFSSIGILPNYKFKKVTRADLIAGYLGQTAIKTSNVIKECLGGVLFIDEAYALGNSEKRDSFAKECIDTLCECLSDHKDKLMVIIAGYEEDLDKCFFSYNQGLNSRFPWRFHTDDYKAPELNKIFEKKVKEINWSLKETIPDTWFENKMDYFKYYGRDMETLLAKTKIAHGRRVFCKPEEEKRILTMRDIDKGFNMFLDNNEVKQRENSNKPLPFMYL